MRLSDGTLLALEWDEATQGVIIVDSLNVARE